MKKIIVAFSLLLFATGCSTLQQEKEKSLHVPDISKMSEPAIIESLVNHYENVKYPKNINSFVLSASKDDFTAKFFEPSLTENGNSLTVTNFTENKRDLYSDLKPVSKYKKNYFTDAQTVYWYNNSYVYSYNSEIASTDDELIKKALSIRNNYNKWEPIAINLNGIKFPDKLKYGINLHSAVITKKPNTERATFTYTNIDSENPDSVDWSLAIEVSDVKIASTAYEVELKNGETAYFSNTDTGYDLEWENDNFKFQLLCSEREECINFANDLI